MNLPELTSITAYHVTVKYPGLGGPEVMLNLHASTGEELDELLAHALPILQEHIGGAIDTTQDGIKAAQPAPVHQLAARRQDEPHYEPDGDELPGRCGGIGHRNAWRESNYGGWYCTGRDENEAAGYCRWIVTEDGELKRSRTKAEAQASAIVGRAGSRR